MRRLLVAETITARELEKFMGYYHDRTGLRPDRIDYVSNNNKIVHSVYPSNNKPAPDYLPRNRK